jgi:hypothetical protein
MPTILLFVVILGGLVAPLYDATHPPTWCSWSYHNDGCYEHDECCDD